MKVLLVILLLAPSVVLAQTPLDLAAIVQTACGPTGYQNPAGCLVQLGRGSFTIGETKLGTCDSTTTQRLGMTIKGHGTSLGAWVPRYPTGGTTLVYNGPHGGTMLSICGSWNFLDDLVLEAGKAGTAVEWRANNSRSAISHFGGMSRFNIRGGVTGIRITGETFNDQIDFLRFSDGTIMDVEVGFDQDSQQAVNNQLDNVEIAARKAGFIVRNGGAEIDGGYVGQWPRADGTYDPAFIGYHLTKSLNPAVAWMSRANIILRDFHAEIHDGWMVKDDSKSTYPVRIEAAQFQHLPQTAAAAARLWSIDSDSPGQLVLDGLSLTASTPTGVTATPRICRRQGPPADVRSLNRAPWMGQLEWRCP